MPGSKTHDAITLILAAPTALAVEMLDVHRLERMIKLGAPAPAPAPSPVSPKVIPLARHLRPVSQYALPLNSSKQGDER
jgi:hypothetical protein